MLGMAFDQFAYLPASDTPGGILIAGRVPDVSFSDVLVGCYSVTVSVASSGDATSWWLKAVYGPQDDAGKILFLEELEAIRDACPGPWAVTGDFNLILSKLIKTMTASIGPICDDSGRRW